MNEIMYNASDLERAFEAGGDWRALCIAYTQERIGKLEWANGTDFANFLKELKKEKENTDAAD